MARALNDRCRARAFLGTGLDKALDDCDTALRLSHQSAAVFDSRALVRLREGKLDRAISDYNSSLKARPGNAWSLFGRGLAELRSGKAAQGQADIDAAKALDSHIADAFAKIGLSP
jgi:tetratricopeptide (TPR) repeat protein